MTAHKPYPTIARTALLIMCSLFLSPSLCAAGKQNATATPRVSNLPLQAEIAKVREALDRIAQAQEAAAAAHNSKKADELSARDLVAQEASAHWAMVNTIVASAGLVLSAGGLLALLASLRLNRQAILAAEHAVVVARESNAAQSRAWVSIVCVLSSPTLSRTHQGVEGVYFNVIGTAENHGNSPATSVSFHAEIALRGDFWLS